MESATSGSAKPAEAPGKLLYAATVALTSTPFRADQLALAYLELVPKVLDYGAKSYAFYRSDDDADHFVHVSYWEDKDDFEQYWFSPGMQKLRHDIQGWHELPLLPHWHTVLERG